MITLEEAQGHRILLQNRCMDTFFISVLEGQKSITCLCCGRASYNPNDIEQKYCGFCHEFHIDRIEHDATVEKPPQGKRVLALMSDGECDVVSWSGQVWEDIYGTEIDWAQVTHWQYFSWQASHWDRR